MGCVWIIFVLLAGAMTVQVTCFHRPEVATLALPFPC